MSLRTRIEAIQALFDATILYSPSFPRGELERMEAMAAPRQAKPQPAAPPVDDIPEAYHEQGALPEGNGMNARQLAAADRLSGLDPVDMWRISLAPITATIEQHFRFPDGTGTKEVVTFRAATYDEYRELRMRFEDEWLSTHEMVAAAQAAALAQQPPQAAAPPAPPQPPPQQQQPQQQPQQPQANPAWCAIHNEWMMTGRDGMSHYHKIGEQPGGKAVWCRGG